MRTTSIAHAAAAVVFAVFAATPAVAHADLIAPDQAACNGKILGDTCTLSGGGSGTCQSRDCDRTVKDADGGTVTIHRTCVECIGSGSGDSGADNGGTVKGGGCSVGGNAREAGGGTLLCGALGLTACAVVSRRQKRRAAAQTPR